MKSPVSGCFKSLDNIVRSMYAIYVFVFLHLDFKKKRNGHNYVFGKYKTRERQEDKKVKMYIILSIKNIFRADYSRWTQYGVGQRKSQEQIRNYINLSEDV